MRARGNEGRAGNLRVEGRRRRWIRAGGSEGRDEKL